ncbi:MAG: sigma factor-like helix-turn-helix DNA-binding protein [Amaricoccus sp.]
MRIPESDFLASLPRLRRYARSLARDPAEADELVRESLERALSREHAWPGENVPGWLLGVMTEVYRGRGRRERAGPERSAPEAAGFERARLAVAIERLSAENRAVLMLVVVEGLSYPEVAVILDLPLGTVMSRLYRARAALADTLRSHNVVAFRRR